MNLKKRLPYLIIFFVLLVIEVLIALYVHDSFIRPYLGDVIVVWVVYTFVRIFLCGHFGSYAVMFCVLIFAVMVELLQGIDIVGLLGLENSAFFSTLIGTSFDCKDILCYLAGSLMGMVGIYAYNRLKNITDNKRGSFN